MEKFIRYLNDQSVVYFDWNVVNKDATGVQYTKEELIDNVLTDVAKKKRSIVLMHDSSTKGTTVDSLPALIETLLSEGASLLPLTEDVPPIQQIEANSIE
jgi:peptidoglycan/xylan/chitin deacetylase (PgdA/CDA1 family)